MIIVALAFSSFSFVGVLCLLNRVSQLEREVIVLKKQIKE